MPRPIIKTEKQRLPIMLDAIRKRSGSVVVKVLLGLLILSFGVWGVNDVFFPGPGRATVASVGNAKIVGIELQNEINREASNLQRRFGNVDREQLRAMGIGMQVVERMVAQALYDQEAAALGLVVSDAIVPDLIRENPAFFGSLGRFDRLVYAQALRNVGYSEETYLQSIRRDIRRSQLLSAMVGGTTPPKTMLDGLYRYRNEKRDAEVLFIRDVDVPTPEDPGDNLLLSVYQSNPEAFTAPEYRKLTAAVIAVEDLAKDIDVTDDELRAAYARERNRFVVPERRTVRQMAFADRAQADAAHAKLTAGGDFAAVAKEVLGAEPASLELGSMTRAQAFTELAGAIFSLTLNSFSEPVESPLGWHVLQVTAIESGSEEPFENVREELARSVSHDRAGDIMLGLSTKLEDELANGTSLEDAGAKLNISVVAIAGVDAAGRAPNGDPVDNLPRAANFLDTAFSTQRGVESRLTEGGTESYFIVRVDDVTPPALKPFASVRGEALAMWQADRRKEGARNLATDLLQRLAADGSSLAALGQAQKLKVEATGPLLRNSRQGGTQPQVLRDVVFATDVGSYGMAEASTGVYIAQVTGIQVADPANDPAGLKRLRDELKAGLESDVRTGFSEGLRQSYPVTINRKAVDEAF